MGPPGRPSMAQSHLNGPAILFPSMSQLGAQTSPQPPTHNDLTPIAISPLPLPCPQEFHPYVFQILAQLIELSTPPLKPVRSAVGVGGRWGPSAGAGDGGKAGASSGPAACTPHAHTRTHSQHARAHGVGISLPPSLPPLCQAYMVVFPPLLTPLYWERPGNIPPLTRLLQARPRESS